MQLLLLLLLLLPSVGIIVPTELGIIRYYYDLAARLGKPAYGYLFFAQYFLPPPYGSMEGYFVYCVFVFTPPYGSMDGYLVYLV